MLKRAFLALTAVLAAAAVATAAGEETVTVTGCGVGTNREEALKDAYRDAIEQAVGLYVDAEQMMQNERLVQDQILTHSNAYIERYDVTKEETRPNGLRAIQIRAVVKKSALAKKLANVMPSQTFQVGDVLRSFHAQSVTTQKRDQDAGALLRNVLKDLNPVTQLMTVSLSPVRPQMKTAEIDDEPMQWGATKTRDFVYFRFSVTLDERKYFEQFLPPLLAVFDQIALAPPKTVYLQARPKALGYGYATYLAGRFTEKSSYGTISIHMPGDEYILVREERNGVPVGKVDLGGAGYDASVENVDNFLEHYHRFEQSKGGGHFDALVITKMNGSRTAFQAKHYRLPMDCEPVLSQWQDRIIGALEDVADYEIGVKKTAYNVVFTGASGEEVFAAPIVFDNDVLRNFAFGDSQGIFRGPSAIGYGLYLTPMVSMNAKARERWVGFDIPRELLPEIKSVKVELGSSAGRGGPGGGRSPRRSGRNRTQSTW